MSPCVARARLKRHYRQIRAAPHAQRPWL